MVGFSHSKNNIYYNSVCLSKLKIILRSLYGLISITDQVTYLALKMFVIFLCPPKRPKYFLHFIFWEDVIGMMLGISTCSIAPLAAMQLSSCTPWGTCAGSRKWVCSLGYRAGEDAVLRFWYPCRYLLWHRPLCIPWVGYFAILILIRVSCFPLF